MQLVQSPGSPGLPTLPLDKGGLCQDVGVLADTPFSGATTELPSLGRSQIWVEGVLSSEDILGTRRSMCKSDDIFRAPRIWMVSLATQHSGESLGKATTRTQVPLWPPFWVHSGDIPWIFI